MKNLILISITAILFTSCEAVLELDPAYHDRCGEVISSRLIEGKIVTVILHEQGKELVGETDFFWSEGEYGCAVEVFNEDGSFSHTIIE